MVSGEDAFLFGGRPGSVRITIQNEESERKTRRIEWRLFQASSSTIAPAGERAALGEREFPAGQGSIIKLPVKPPEVRTITTFVLKVWAGTEELGRARITVCPAKLFSGLKASGIEVREPDELLGPLLKGAENEGETRLTIVRLQDREAEWSKKELAPAVLYIVGPGVQGAERLMPLKFPAEKGRRTAILQDWFVPDLDRNPLSQLRLLRAIDLILNPEQVQSPEPGG